MLLQLISMAIGCPEISIIICNNENVLFDKAYMVLSGTYIKIWISKPFWTIFFSFLVYIWITVFMFEYN